MKKLLLAFAACAASVCGFGLTIDEQAANLKPGEWLAVPMTGAASDIVTKGLAAKTGDKAIAYINTGLNGYTTDETVNGVSFSSSRESFTFTPNYQIPGKDDAGNCGLDTYYGNRLMNRYWKGNISGGSGPTTFTVTVPAAGTYLMQLVIHHPSANKVYLTADDSVAIFGHGDDWYYGGTFVHAFTMDAAGPYQFVLQFSGEVVFNMFQLRDITQHEVTKPSIGSVTAQILKSGANITLSGVKVGTDEQGLLATSYDVYFASVEKGGALPEATKVLTGLDAASCSFAVPGFASGKVYDYSVFIRNSGGVDSKIVTGILDGRSIAERAQSLPVGSWAAYRMTGDEKDIVCYGEPAQNNGHAMAYAVDAGTLNGVSFIKSTDGVRGYVIVAPSYKFGQTSSGGDKCGLDGTYYGDVLMDKYFKASYAGQNVHFSVDVPSDGTYVMQIVYHHKGSAYDQWKNPRACQITLMDNPLIEVSPASDESGDWYYGGTMIYKFNADAATTIEFDVSYKFEIVYNMFQLRKVPHEDEPIGEVVEPSIGKASVIIRGRSASFAFENVVIGTDEKGHAAKTYDLYVDRGDDEFVKVVEGVKSETCSFFDANLAAGDYAYKFKIVNDKGVESEAKDVEFSVGEVVTISDRAATLKPGQWLALPMTGDAADIITEGVLATNAQGQPMAYMSTDKGTDPVSDASVNNVPFIQSTEGFVGNVEASPRGVGQTAAGAGNSGMGGSLYGDTLMGRIFKAGWADSAVTFTVSVPEKGTYLLQMACHFQGDSDGKEIVLLDENGQRTDIKIRPASATEAEGWYYGGTFVHVFKVEEACTYSFRLDYDHEIEYNMFQLRKVKRNRATIIMVK